jgi:hypothetical protein
MACGSRPLSIEKRDGAQIGKLQYALSNTTERSARRAMCGARTTRWPYTGSAGAASWSTIRSRMLGLCGVVGDLTGDGGTRSMASPTPA